MRRTARKAFTLVEILIVVVILGILAAIVVPQFASAADDARGGNTATQLSTLQNAIELFRARVGRYPDLSANWNELTADSDGDGIADLDSDGDGVVDSPYIKAAPINPYVTATDGFLGTSVDEGAGGTGSAAAAWHFDTDTAQLFASFYDEANRRVNTPRVATD